MTLSQNRVPGVGGLEAYTRLEVGGRSQRAGAFPTRGGAEDPDRNPGYAPTPLHGPTPASSLAHTIRGRVGRGLGVDRARPWSLGALKSRRRRSRYVTASSRSAAEDESQSTSRASSALATPTHGPRDSHSRPARRPDALGPTPLAFPLLAPSLRRASPHLPYSLRDLALHAHRPTDRLPIDPFACPAVTGPSRVSYAGPSNLLLNGRASPTVYSQRTYPPVSFADTRGGTRRGQWMA